MSEKIRQFIDQLASGHIAEAKDTLENELSSKAFSSLNEYKKELAGSIFGGTQETEEELLAQEGFEQLLEDFNVINEVSLGAKIKAYAHHSSQSFEHGDSGNDDESEHHQKRANKILANISKHHGSAAVGHAEKAADSSIFGTDRSRSRGADKLSGGLRQGLNQNVTKSGKIPKATQSAMKNRLKEELEEELLAQEGFEQLLEDFNVINEVSLGAKIKAYAHHSSQSFEHGDSGNDDESEHHQKRADKILANISKHHGSDAANHAEKAASSSIFGTDRSRSRGADKLSGGLRQGLNQNVTKSGKIPKATQSAMKNRLK